MTSFRAAVDIPPRHLRIAVLPKSAITRGDSESEAALASAAKVFEELGHQVEPVGHNQRADTRGTAELVRRQGDEIGADCSGVEGNLSGRLDRIAMKNRAISPSDCGDLSYGLDYSGLVVREHHRD